MSLQWISVSSRSKTTVFLSECDASYLNNLFFFGGEFVFASSLHQWQIWSSLEF